MRRRAGSLADGLLGRAAVLLAFVFALGSCTRSSTELVVVIDTDLAVPAVLDGVVLEAIDSTGASQRTQGALDGDGALSLPVTFGLSQPDGAATDVTLTARGLRGEREVIRRTVHTRFVAGERRVVMLALGLACAGERCNDEPSLSCEPNTGRCQSATVDPSTLPTWDRTAPRWTPEPAGSDPPVRLAANEYTACVRRRSGALACWGSNELGMLGDGSGPASKGRPTAVAEVSDATLLALGRRHACARRAGGQVVCWGSNQSGQLCDGSTTDRRTPVAAPALADAAQLAPGGFHTCALSMEGTVQCCGANYALQLGGSANGQGVAVVPNLNDAVEVVAGSEFSCARRRAGTVLCWGKNTDGQVGTGTTSDAERRPVTVVGLRDVVQLSAGVHHTCARRSDGTAVCWGANGSGPLGDGTRTSRAAPGASVALTDVIDLQAGGFFGCALAGDGHEVQCWGDNTAGTLGAGTVGGTRPGPAPTAPLP